VPDTVFRALVENAPDAIVVSRNGVVLYANSAAARLLGHDDVAEMIGKPMTFLDRASAEVMMRRVQQLAETGEKLVPREYPARRRDGTTITAEITSSIIDFDGAPAVLAYARDVTDRKRLQTQLAHADRLAALGTMAAGVAHEINNPLSFIGLATEMLGRSTGPVDPTLVGELKRGVDRIAGIVRELRFFGRDDDEAAGLVDLRAVIDAAERLVAHEIRPRGTLIKDVPELPAVQGVGRRFEQVFVNLLLNAAHSLDEGARGRIFVRARVTDTSVVVTVEDNGRGISEENLALVFDPFFTTRAAGGGTGLGLSISRDIVVRAGGELSARSAVGQGTTMELTLPRAATPQVDVSASRKKSGEHAAAGAVPWRVLVVDDEPIIARLVSKILAPAATVVAETNSARALERMLAEPFDVIVCDVMMPGLTGIDLHERMARDRPEAAARFVFMTGGTYTARARDYLDGIPNARLDKPFRSDRLFAVVESVASSAAAQGRAGPEGP
jgi:PAS domain S-box-containing protein